MTSACTCQCAIFRHGSGMAVAYVAPHAGAETWRRLYNLMRKRGFTARPLSAHGSGTEFSGANPHMQSVSGLEWGGQEVGGSLWPPNVVLESVPLPPLRHLRAEAATTETAPTPASSWQEAERICHMKQEMLLRCPASVFGDAT